MRIADTVHFDWYKKAFVTFVIAALLLASAAVTDADLAAVITGGPQAAAFLSKFMQPDLAYIPELIDPMMRTIKMSVLGTVVGFAVAVPLAFLATTVVTRNRVVTGIVRLLLNIVRTIPTLLLAALAVAIMGIGEFTGVVTIAIFTLGVTSQLIFETIETIDYAPIEAAEAVGATRMQIAAFSIAPQVASQLASYFFYAFEINVRASTVLGYVGAGGIGVILNASLGLFRYDRVSVVILMIFVVVGIVDAASEAVRRRLA